jgi:type II secretion system protein I
MLTFFRNEEIRRSEIEGLEAVKSPNQPLIIQNPGFILLEVLVAVAILGAALAVLLGSVNKNLILTSESRDLVIAETLAQSKLTEVELEGFPEQRQDQGEFVEAPGFKWFLSVTPATIPGINTEMRTVRLLITWDEGRKEFELTLAMSNLK